MACSTRFICLPDPESKKEAKQLIKQYGLETESISKYRKDIRGLTSDKLMAVGYAGNNNWWIHCTCGKIQLKPAKYITCGRRSCGCWLKELHDSYRNPDNTDPNFRLHGRLRRALAKEGRRFCKRWQDVKLFTKDLGPQPDGYTFYFPKDAEILNSKNCKWLPYEKVMELRLRKYPTKWNYTKTSYYAMLDRCYSKAHKSSETYSKRGIKVCKRWIHGDGELEGFGCFVKDMGLRPKGMTIDRIDNDIGYRPSNCRWATPKEQRINQRTRIHMVTYQGKTLCLRDWTRETGIKHNTLLQRYKLGNSGNYLFRPV